MFDPAGGDARAYLLEGLLARRPPGDAGLEAASDWQSALAWHQLDPLRGRALLEGRVVGYTGHARNLKVSLEGARGAVRGLLLAHGALGPYGARPTADLPPGSRVLCAWKPGEPECWVLGSAPDPLTDPGDCGSDVVVPGSNCGLQADEYLWGAFLLGGEDGQGFESCGAADASCGRPSDSLPVGEWGAACETGLGIHLDPFLAYLRASEETGVFAFYADERLRVAGHTLELTSACRERLDYQHAGWAASEEGSAPSFLEALGVKDGEATDPSRAVADADVQLRTPWYYYLEPAFDDQMPYYRLCRYQGRLGGGYKHLLSAWPDAPTLPLRYSQDVSFRGLAGEQLFGTGRMLTRTAKGLILAKHPRAVVPKRRRPAAGAPADPPSAAQPKAEVAAPAGLPDEEAPLLRACALLDQLAYSGNFEGVQPFWEQPSSWYVPEEDDASAYLGGGGLADHALLATQQHLPAPEPVAVEIDGRYGTALVWPNSAYIALLDDGGIALGDGWGSELRMAAGSMWRSAPGDIYDTPGRSYVNWSGYDAVLRAHNSVDITSSRKDVRLKAEHNVMVLGGNELCGGVLIESRAPAAAYDFAELGEGAVTTGVVLRAPDAQVAVIARDHVALAERHTHALPAGVASGRFVIDVGAGAGKVATYSRSFERRLGTPSAGQSGYALDVALGGSDAAYLELSPSQLFVGAPARVDGSLLAAGCVAAGGWLYSKAGHAATGLADDYAGRVSQLATAASDALAGGLTAVSARAAALAAHASATADQLKSDFRDAASGDVEDSVFSLRTPGQYGTDQGFVHYEALWQQQARALGTALPVWRESAVLVGAAQTAPHPGYNAWLVAASGRQVQYTLLDQASGAALDRGTPGSPAAAYAAPEYAGPAAYVLDANYTIARDP